MTKQTNIFDLPASIVRAINNDAYDAGKAEISTTRLISPAQIVTLAHRHKDEITEDVSERVWSFIGQACHKIAERAAAPGSIAEQRFFAPMEGWTVSGAVDLIEGSKLIDYKVTSVWTHIYKSRIAEWTEQGNVNRWLYYQQDGHREIDALENILILRDWSKKDADKGGRYPKVQIVVQPLALWSLASAEEYVRTRVKLHQQARAATDENQPPCTDEERWLNKDGGFRRCAQYCAAAPFCHQFNNDPSRGDQD